MPKLIAGKNSVLVGVRVPNHVYVELEKQAKLKGVDIIGYARTVLENAVTRKIEVSPMEGQKPEAPAVETSGGLLSLEDVQAVQPITRREMWSRVQSRNIDLVDGKLKACDLDLLLRGSR